MRHDVKWLLQPEKFELIEIGNRNLDGILCLLLLGLLKCEGHLKSWTQAATQLASKMAPSSNRPHMKMTMARSTFSSVWMATTLRHLWRQSSRLGGGGGPAGKRKGFSVFLLLNRHTKR